MVASKIKLVKIYVYEHSFVKYFSIENLLSQFRTHFKFVIALYDVYQKSLCVN